MKRGAYLGPLERAAPTARAMPPPENGRGRRGRKSLPGMAAVQITRGQSAFFKKMGKMAASPIMFPGGRAKFAKIKFASGATMMYIEADESDIPFFSANKQSGLSTVVMRIFF